MPTSPARPTSTSALVASGAVADATSPFALPRGLRGRLAGWYMGLGDRQHRELAAVTPLRPKARLVEVGFGPGQMLAMLRRQEPTLTCRGVDPSEAMVAAARRRNPGAELVLGAAAAIPFPDASADVVLSVNNIAMWPDLDAAFSEIRRVLAPSGSLVVAWHGGQDPRGHQRRLVLSPARLSDIDAACRRHFPSAQRRQARYSELWEAAGGGT